MLRPLTVSFLVLLMVCTACSGTTVIEDDMLAQSPSADLPTSVPEPDPTAETPDAADESDARGDRDLGDSEPTESDAGESDAGETAESDPGPSETAESDPGQTIESDPGDSDSASNSSSGFGSDIDAQIEGLLADCEDGSDMACDILFAISPVDSAAEETALRCGGRSDVFVLFCTEGIDNDGEDIWFAELSPGLPTVLASCQDGDMTACDFLYFRSAVGSEYEEIGNTCDGRTEIALPDCRTAFGA